jgi:uncharacterized protein with FMN-binding domain
MPKVIVALIVTAVAVVLLAGYDTKPPRTVNPNSALKPRPTAAPPKLPPGARAALGPATITPFSVIQVQATVQHGKLMGVKTVTLTGDGPHTQAINARAEPLLRASALKAQSADVDVVSGATYTSRSWKLSLQAAIDKARGG